jgi:uncharacterized membrane protein YhaH (DUF805 family)
MDPNQINHMTRTLAGMMGFFLLFGLAIYALMIFLYWRTLTKAGLAGPLSLLVLIPGIGWLVVLCILAFADWKVVPVAASYPGLQPYPPPPPNYPPPPPPSGYNPPPPPQP